MSRLKITNLPIDGLKLIERMVLGDSRGHLSRLFCAEELSAAGWIKPIAQINYTYTLKKGAVRGMHYQRSPYSEMKLVSCIRGELLDVVVDLRNDSDTYLPGSVIKFDHHAFEIKAKKGTIQINKLQLPGKNIITYKDLYNSNSQFSTKIKSYTGK